MPFSSIDTSNCWPFSIYSANNKEPVPQSFDNGTGSFLAFSVTLVTSSLGGVKITIIIPYSLEHAAASNAREDQAATILFSQRSR
jgi:hypothetical protein